MEAKYKKGMMNSTVNEFKTFIETCIIGRKSMLIGHDGEVFTEVNIDACIKVVEKIVESNKKIAEAKNKSEKIETKDLWEEIKKSSLSNEQRIVIQYALWFVDFAIENRDFTKKDYAENIKKDYKGNTGIGTARQCFSGSVRGAVELSVLENWKKWKGWEVDSFEAFKKIFIDKYDKVKDDGVKSLHPSLRNIILYLCDQENYEPAIADSDKNKIVKVLYPMFFWWGKSF